MQGRRTQLKAARSALYAALLSLSITVPAFAADDDTLLAVTPEELPRLWERKRGDRPTPPLLMSSDANVPCVEVDAGVPVPWQRGSRPGFCGSCVVIGYVIEPDGRTSSYRVLRVVPEVSQRDFGRHSNWVRRAMRKWRFEPSAANHERQAAYSYFTHVLIMHDRVSQAEVDGAAAALGKLCALDSFP